MKRLLERFYGERITIAEAVVTWFAIVGFLYLLLNDQSVI